MNCTVHLSFHGDLGMWVYKQFRVLVKETPSAFILLDVVPACKIKDTLIMKLHGRINNAILVNATVKHTRVDFVSLPGRIDTKLSGVT